MTKCKIKDVERGIARIICAGEECCNFSFEQNDLIIAADGGLEYARKWGVVPDVIIGDFDSLGYRPQGENVLVLPKEKDDTDTLAAIKYALNKGYSQFVLYCASGGECDHTLANISLLGMLARNKKIAYMFDKDRVITVINGEKLRFDSACNGKLSVFSFAERAKVVIKGLKYEFDGELTDDFPLGCGNEFVGQNAFVYAEHPTVVVFGEEIFKNKMFSREV